MRRIALTICILASMIPRPALAAVEVTFQDGDPWDTFVITSSGCAIIRAELTLDLATSVGAVVIDTEYGGLGTKDPMPAELASGRATLAAVPDGATTLTVAISKLSEDSPIVLQFDADDTISFFRADKIVVTPDEIEGATARLTYDGQTTQGTFGPDGTVFVPLPTAVKCLLIS